MIFSAYLEKKIYVNIMVTNNIVHKNIAKF